MEAFVERVAQHILANYEGSIHELAVVFPNRRAGNFLKRKLASLSSKPIWAPQTFSTEEFMVRLSGMELLDNLRALFKLYSVYQSCETSQADPFEKFLTWGPTVVKDFNEIDLFQVDAKQILTYLYDVEKIKQWNLGDSEPTEIQQKYLEFWSKLPLWYQTYTQTLLNEKVGYQGLLFKEVAKNKASVADALAFKKVILAGFNALNTCEEQVFSYLIDCGKAEIIWDLDTYYTRDPIQEAGFNFRKLSQSSLVKKAVKPLEGNYLSELPRTITVTGVPMHTAQARTMQLLLDELSQKENISIETAVVLGDEELIYPVLSAIPTHLGNFNATLGLPFKSTKAYSFLLLLLQLMEHTILHKRIPNKPLLDATLHPYTETWLGPELLKAIQKLLKEKRIKHGFTTQELLSGLPPEAEVKLSGFFNPNLSPKAASELIQSIFDVILQQIGPVLEEDETLHAGENLLSQELYFSKQVLSKLTDFAELLPAQENGLKALEKVIVMLAGKESIPLVGEPLKGLQVMGMLETRNLDFKHVFLLGFNEGKIPSAENTATFITHETRFHFGLPVQHERDAVFAYHFYRLMQRAEKVWLIYDADEEQSEASRFLLQVEKEWAKVNKQLKLVYRNPFVLPSAGKEPEIRIKKTEEHLAFLKSRGQERGFSPSALNSFRNCSLQFYLNYIARIEGEGREEDMLGSDVFGTIIHAVLETLFIPLVGITLNPALIKGLVEKYPPILEQKFEEFTHIEAKEAGRYSIDLEVASVYIRKYLNKLQTEMGSDTIVLALEKTMEVWFERSNGEKVKLSGKTDRIDLKGKQYQVLDFKTGKIESKNVTVKDWEDLLVNPDKDKAFQLISYAWMLHKSDGVPIEDVFPAFISTRNLEDWMMGLKLNNSLGDKSGILDQSSITDFESILATLLDNLYDSNQGFEQTEQTKACEYCGFKKFCSR
jgi:hypothetical protein